MKGGGKTHKTKHGREYTIPTSPKNFEPLSNGAINLRKSPRVGISYKHVKHPRVKYPLAGFKLYSGKPSNTHKKQKVHEMNLSLYFPNRHSLESSMKAKIKQNTKLRNVLGYGGNRTQKIKKKVRFTRRNNK